MTYKWGKYESQFGGIQQAENLGNQFRVHRGGREGDYVQASGEVMEQMGWFEDFDWGQLPAKTKKSKNKK